MTSQEILDTRAAVVTKADIQKAYVQQDLHNWLFTVDHVIIAHAHLRHRECGTSTKRCKLLSKWC